MKDKIVLIIGAGPGLGSSLAQKFSQSGYHVFASRRERNKKDLQNLAKGINKKGFKCTPYPMDARNEVEIQELFKTAAKQGKIECVIFNIGANVFFPISKTTSRVFKKVWEMATFAGFLTGKEAAKYMLKNKKGTIIFTGATASMRGSSGFSAFASAKFGLRAVAQSMARELGPKGIHVAHTVIDGAIDHPWIKENFPDIYKLKKKDGILKPDEIAEVYLDLHHQKKSVWTHEIDLRPYMEKF